MALTEADRGDEAYFAQLAQAVEYLRNEQLEDASSALEALHQQRPLEPKGLQFLGILRHTQGRNEEAISLLRQAAAALPGEPGLHNNLGNVLLENQHLDEALAAYQCAASLSAGQPTAVAGTLNNIGILHRRRKEWPEAEAVLRQAVALAPDNAEAWYNLSATLVAQGKVNEGVLANSRAVLLWPSHLQARESVLSALLLLGERERAAALYREWLAEEPNNPVVQHQLAACLGQDVPDRASDGAMELLFDNFAASFDAHLGYLDYRAPQLVADALRGVAGEPKLGLDIADVGCGTGLCGPLLRPWARHLVGCDLSVGMLRRAKPRKVYDKLHKAELVYYLQTQGGAFDVVVSADTLCYFGVLGEAFAAAHGALRQGGWLIFTVEAARDSQSDDHVLQSSGRYAHGRAYLERELEIAGLQLVILKPEGLRMETGVQVPGWLVAAQRAPSRS